MDSKANERSLTVRASLFAFVVLAAGAWWMYGAAGRGAIEYSAKFGELLLQLAVVVVIGGFIKELGAWFQERGAALRERDSQRRELVSRARANHVVVERARELLIAHRSPKTYSEQLQRLIALRYEVEDLQADVEAGKDLFRDSDGVSQALGGIVTYLKRGAHEYGPAHGHEHVDAGWKSKEPFDRTLKKHGMKWTLDFLSGGPLYQTYQKHLSQSKGVIRAEVYGA